MRPHCRRNWFFLLLLLFRQPGVHLKEPGDTLRLGHLRGEAVGLHHGTVVPTVCLLLKADKLCRFLHAIDVLQEVEPEPLALPFLIAFACPPPGKLRSGCLLLLLCVHIILRLLSECTCWSNVDVNVMISH